MMTKHRWLLDADGNRDNWSLEAGAHNGPGCEACLETFCVHCVDVDSLNDCPTPPIPPGLCGINGCVFLPHDDTAHSWATTGPRIYTTDLNGVGIRREADNAVREELEASGRKVFTTKGSAG